MLKGNMHKHVKQSNGVRVTQSVLDTLGNYGPSPLILRDRCPAVGSI